MAINFTDAVKAYEKIAQHDAIPGPGGPQVKGETRYQPGHPAADTSGYVKISNVNTLVEMTDMREAQRSYEANLKVMQAARTMLQRTIDLLR